MVTIVNAMLEIHLLPDTQTILYVHKCLREALMLFFVVVSSSWDTL